MENILKKIVSFFKKEPIDLPKRFKIKSCSATTHGFKRKTNQDNFYTGGFITDFEILQSKAKEIFVYEYEKDICVSEVLAVFDGMGGMNAGEKASTMAAMFLKEKLLNNKEFENIHLGINYLQDYAKKVSSNIYKESGKMPDLQYMGTTFVGLCICGDKAVVVNVGDSRGYVYSEGVLSQLSIDHTIVAENVRNKIMTKEEAKNSNDHHKLTKFLGMPIERGTILSSISDVFTFEKPVRFLLCSDGLYGQVDDADIEKLLQNENLLDCTRGLLGQALRNGGLDNITATVVDVEPLN